MSAAIDSAPCPCQSGDSYAACCGRYLDAGELPVTAEALMRSRYSAYTLGRRDYLLDTWHPSTRPPAAELAALAPVTWLGLTIVHTQAGGADDAAGAVEFVARYKPAGRAARLHEVSRFVREAGRWLYLAAASPSEHPRP
jgi:SEC-C motif-containing protein